MAKKAAPAATKAPKFNEHPKDKEFRGDEPSDQYIFADGARGFALSGGVARFSLTQEIFEGAAGVDGPYHVMAARIAVPLPTFFALHNWMGTIIEGLKEQGIVIEGSAPNDSQS